MRERPWGKGLDAATGEYVDLVKAGIVDPVKVTRNAVANAAVDRGPPAHHGERSSWRSRCGVGRAGNGGGHGHGGHGHQHGPGF